MNDTDDGERSESLDVIDLESELGMPTRRPRPRLVRTRRPTGWPPVATIVCIATLGIALAAAARTHGTRTAQPNAKTAGVHPSTMRNPPLSSSETQPSTPPTTPPSRPRGPILGRYYPVLDRTDTSTFVLPSGLTVTLTGGLTKAIGGLGVNFGALVDPKTDAEACCSLAASIYHGSPSDLFNSLGAGPIVTPELVSPAHAKQADLKTSEVAFGVLSTGDWTLTAVFEDEHVDNADLLKRLHGWRLRPTPEGAVLEVPANSTIGQEGVSLGRTPDLSNREVVLTSHVEPCESTPDTKPTINTENGAVGYWCAHGLSVEADGPLSYVKSVAANLKVTAAEPIAVSLRETWRSRLVTLSFWSKELPARGTQNLQAGSVRSRGPFRGRQLTTIFVRSFRASPALTA